MKNLKCDATKCVYNKKCECYAGKICVDGSQAVTTSDTYCATFRENENNATLVMLDVAVMKTMLLVLQK